MLFCKNEKVHFNNRQKSIVIKHLQTYGSDFSSNFARNSLQTENPQIKTTTKTVIEPVFKFLNK